MSEIKVEKITDFEKRNSAMEVIKEVYLKEKKWITNPQDEIPVKALSSDKVSWFLATYNGSPAGMIKLGYDPSLEFPPEMGVKLKKGIDINELGKNCRIVEIGRFMIKHEYRKNIRIALNLMKAAIKEVVERDYTHFITDVFENEEHSPLRFHTRILGFEVIGTHLHGELNCNLTRIILTLDILKSYARIKRQGNSFYKKLTEGIQELLDKKLDKARSA